MWPFYAHTVIGCKDKTSSWHLIGFPEIVVVILGQQYYVGEKPTVVLYTYIIINRHAGTPSKTTIQKKR